MDLNYILLADCLWYSGHILTGISIVVNHYHFYTAIVIVILLLKYILVDTLGCQVIIYI